MASIYILKFMKDLGISINQMRLIRVNTSKMKRESAPDSFFVYSQQEKMRVYDKFLIYLIIPVMYNLLVLNSINIP